MYLPVFEVPEQARAPIWIIFGAGEVGPEKKFSGFFERKPNPPRWSRKDRVLVFNLRNLKQPNDPAIRLGVARKSSCQDGELPRCRFCQVDVARLQPSMEPASPERPLPEEPALVARLHSRCS